MSNHPNSLKSILILIFAIFLFIPLACEQTIDPLQDEELIKISQEWYAKSTKNARLNDNVYEKFTPKWGESEVIDLKNGGKMVTVPLQSSLSVTYSNEISFMRKMIVEFDKRMNIKNTEILEIVGTPEFLQKNKNLIIENRNGNDIKDFEGGIITSDVNYTTHDGKTFNKGKKNGIAKIANKEKGARKMFYCVDWYWVQGGNWSYLYTTCEGGSSGGGGGGGGNGNNYTPSQDIKNDVTNPCLSGVVSKFLQSSHGINDIIQGVFSCNTDVNLVFSNADISGDDGQTQVEHANPDKSIFDVNIIINNNQADRSQEYIASTIIHEVLHAYMNYTGQPLGNDSQHLAMGNNYVNLMRDYLQTMYGINSTNATILSLGGLEGYPWFSSLLNSRNISSNQYWQTKQNFKNKTSGTPCP